MKVKALSISLGIVWAAGVVILGWVAIGGWGDYAVDVLGSLYIGYEASFTGAIIGGIWAFVDAAVAGFFIAFLYNFFAEDKEKNKNIFCKEKSKKAVKAKS